MVAGPGYAGSQDQILDVRFEPPTCRRFHRVIAAAGGFCHWFVTGAYHVVIVAGPAGQGVNACTAIQAIVSGSAQQCVVAVFAIKRVVAVATIQRVLPTQTMNLVGSAEALENVVAFISLQFVVAGIASAVDVAGAVESEIFDVCAQQESDRGTDQIVTCVHAFRHHIECAVHDIGVVSQSAGHDVVAGAAVQPVVIRISDQGVGQVVADAVDSAITQDEVLDEGRELIAKNDAGADRVGPAARFLDDGGVHADHVGVVAGAADQCCGDEGERRVQQVCIGGPDKHAAPVGVGDVGHDSSLE